MLGTGSVGRAVAARVGETERTARLGEKKEVNLDEVLEKDELRPWGPVVADEGEAPEERDCDEAGALDTLLRGIGPRARRRTTSLGRQRKRQRLGKGGRWENNRERARKKVRAILKGVSVGRGGCRCGWEEREK